MAEISGLFVTKKTHKKYLVLIYSILKLNSICVSFLSMPHIVKLGLLFLFFQVGSGTRMEPSWFENGFFLVLFLFRFFFFASKETKNTGFLACGIKKCSIFFHFLFSFYEKQQGKVHQASFTDFRVLKRGCCLFFSFSWKRNSFQWFFGWCDTLTMVWYVFGCPLIIVVAGAMEYWPRIVAEAG